MQKSCLMLVMALSLGNLARAEEHTTKWPKRLWKASIAAVIAGSAVDAQSSFGRHETNSLLANRRGSFSYQALGLKLAVTGAALGAQHYLLGRHPGNFHYQTGALINFAVAGALTGVAVHNYTVPAVR